MSHFSLLLSHFDKVRASYELYVMAERFEGKSTHLSANQTAVPSYATDITHRYPTFRDEPFKTVNNWLDGKRYDDGAEGLWRINDALYDLEDFARTHPGGSEWIQLTK
uniref:Cytochrome b5 heme-binding domain-containing protein n=1 Tax=Anopheles christyi TaxID=43041 RepID=A0A182KCP8_9DIPT